MIFPAHSIAHWARLVREVPFSLARFGDGEFLCIQGHSGGNSHGCAYTLELKQDLIDALEERDKLFLKGMQRITRHQLLQIEPLLSGSWVDSEIFADSLARGELMPLFRAIQEKRSVLVSSSGKEKILQYFPKMDFIEVPRTNAHAQKEQILEKCRAHKDAEIFLFACGMAAGAFVHALHKEMRGVTLFDIGHIFDPFCGEMSRDYLPGVDPVILRSNLW